MSKLVVILGATGKQGGSVVDAFLEDLSFQVRAVARNPTSPASNDLRAKGVDVVQGDVTDLASLNKAFKGANYIYAMTPDIGVNGAAIAARGNVTSIVEEAYRLEIEAGKNIIHAVNSTLDSIGVFILSALSAAREHSGEIFKHIYHFDAKANLVKHIESEYPELASKTVVLQLGMFASNWRMPTPFRPQKQLDGRYRVAMPCSSSTQIPFIDPARDPALFVKAIASQRLPIPGHSKILSFAGYRQMTTFDAWVQLLKQKLRIDVYYEQVDLETWAREVVLLPGLGMELAEMWAYCEKVGYFGGPAGGTKNITELVLEEPATTMEEFIEREDWSSLLE